MHLSITGPMGVVLAHNPDSANTSYRKRIDLMISGHTHGGQVNLPFLGAPFLPVQNKEYSSGLKRSPRGCPVFISKGIGWAICPVRFNCFPEIAVLELVPAPGSGHVGEADAKSLFCRNNLLDQKYQCLYF